MSVPMIAGLYPYRRNGETHPYQSVLEEIRMSLEINPLYRERLFVLAGDASAARELEAFGLQVHRVFDDAPAHVMRDMAHKMKHWMCLWALKEFGEFLWVDWDTVLLRPLDEAFWSACRERDTPKFVRIPDYWATVNCGVYYASKAWIEAMEHSFGAQVSEPNDELLWTSVLPDDVREQEEFWWGERVVQISSREDFAHVTSDTYFTHVKQLDWAEELRALHPSR